MAEDIKIQVDQGLPQDVEAMWTPAIRNYQGHAICDQKVAALEKAVAELKSINAVLTEKIEEFTNRHNPVMDPGARGKATR
jgi:hypothetical protein